MDDAHCHYQEAELEPFWGEILPQLASLPLRRAVVNGTQSEDWPGVEAWAARLPQVVPSFGLHPWYVMQPQPQWMEKLRHLLEKYPHAGVGEFGLDQWVAGHNLAVQLPIFRAHWALAQEFRRVASIHCVQAWGPLMAELRSLGPAKRGFLIHAYGGPLEMVAEFVRLGAYFSFSPYFLHERKAKQREVFARIPEDRLLIETDAPALYPPNEHNPHPLVDATSQTPLNHPANLRVSLQGLARLRGKDENSLNAALKANFDSLWSLETESLSQG